MARRKASVWGTYHRRQQRKAFLVSVAQSVGAIILLLLAIPLTAAVVLGFELAHGGERAEYALSLIRFFTN